MRAVARWWRVNKVVVFDTNDPLLSASASLFWAISFWRVVMVGTIFGIPRCRKEGLVLGVWIRHKAKACVCRWEETREPICGR